MRDSIELLKPALGKASETLNAVDMMCATHELVVTMMDSEVLTISDINQSVIATPAVRVDDCSRRDATANNGLQSCFLAVGYNFGVNTAITLKDAEDDCFTRGSTASITTHPSNAEIAFIHSDLARSERRSTLTFFSDPDSHPEKDRGHATARKFGQLSRVASSQIEYEVAHELTEFMLANFRPPVIAV